MLKKREYGFQSYLQTTAIAFASGRIVATKIEATCTGHGTSKNRVLEELQDYTNKHLFRLIKAKQYNSLHNFIVPHKYKHTHFM